MQIDKMLILSTAHISEIEMQRISDDEAPGFVVYPNDYGAFVLVDRYPGYSEATEPDTMPRLSAVAGYARGNGCNWIKLDADADTVDALPTFDW